MPKFVDNFHATNHSETDTLCQVRFAVARPCVSLLDRMTHSTPYLLALRPFPPLPPLPRQ